MPHLFTNTIPDVFDEKFIQKCLAAQNLLENGNEVMRVQEEHLRGPEGNTGTVVTRLRITYRFHQHNLPDSMVLKRTDTAHIQGPSDRDKAIERLIVYSAGLSDVNMLKREILFYNKFFMMVSEPCGLKIPDIYLTAISGSSTVLSRALFIMFKRKEHVKGAILMEDLSSGRNLDPVDICSKEILTRLCTEVGRLYGYTARTLILQNGTIGDNIKPPLAYTYKMCLMTSHVGRLIKKRWTPRSGLIQELLKRWASTDYKLLREDPETLEALLALQQHFVPYVYDLHFKLTNFFSILQGDFHAGNFMMMPNGDVKMFDMQMWGAGHPAEELCYFLASNVDPTDESDEIALRMVHTAMETASQGVARYEYDDLKRDIDICTLHYVAANVVRRALFETPDSIEKLIRKLGRKAEGLQRVLRVREERLLLRLKNIWKRDRTFRLLPASNVANKSVRETIANSVAAGIVDVS